MELAVVGGTAFIGRHIVEHALAQGHSVTVFHRGVTNAGLFPGVREVLGDRNDPHDLARLADRTYDAVIDTCAYLPREVSSVADALATMTGHYLFVSSVSVYRPTDGLTFTDSPRASVADLDDPDTEIVDDLTYGALKARCEDLATERFERCAIVRPTYVIGPHDRSDRFTWWVRRIAAGGPMLAAEPADGPVQVIDARDLAAWCLALLEHGRTGAFDGVGPAAPISWRTLFAEIAGLLGGPDHLPVWVGEGWLRERGVQVEVDLPMWASAAEASMMRCDVTGAEAAGLRLRPLADTVTDLVAWDNARGLPVLTTGLDDQRHAALVAEALATGH